MVVDDTITAHLLLLGILDVEKELGKLGKKREELMAKLQVCGALLYGLEKRALIKQVLETKMASGDYATRTPEDVRNVDAERLAKAKAELAEVEQHLQDMQGVAA